MVKRSDVISSRWSCHFWLKMRFFNFFFNIQSTNCGWNNTKCLFMYYTSSQKKKTFIAILTWFLIFGKIQGSDHCWWRHEPPAAPPPIKHTSPSWKDQRVSTKGKIVGRGSINPLPFVSRWVWICVYVQGLTMRLEATRLILTIANATACVLKLALTRMTDALAGRRTVASMAMLIKTVWRLVAIVEGFWRWAWF